MEKPKRARRRKLDTAKADLEPLSCRFSGGQGVHREVESEGHEGVSSEGWRVQWEEVPPGQKSGAL
jgi:hypothetical protein